MYFINNEIIEEFNIPQGQVLACQLSYMPNHNSKIKVTIMDTKLGNTVNYPASVNATGYVETKKIASSDSKMIVSYFSNKFEISKSSLSNLQQQPAQDLENLAGQAALAEIKQKAYQEGYGKALKDWRKELKCFCEQALDKLTDDEKIVAQEGLTKFFEFIQKGEELND